MSNNNQEIKKILGLDLGTNSIGWAFIEESSDSKAGKIIKLGSRIVPMDTNMLNDFSAGKPVSKNSTRRMARGARRNLQRYKLRRQRLILALQTLGWIPTIEDPKLFSEYLAKSISEPNRKLLPWELYELRAKAMKEIISLEEMARILLHLNQRRGFNSNRKAQEHDETATNSKEIDSNSEEENTDELIKESFEKVRIKQVVEESGKKISFRITLEDSREGKCNVRLQEGEECELQIKPKTLRNGEINYFFAVANRSSWGYRKDYINKLIEESGLTVGQ